MKSPFNRRYLQFSLRTLLVVMTVVGVLLSVAVKRVRNRRAAIRAIDELGGTYGVHISGPKWLRSRISDEKYLYDASRVSLGPQNQGYDPQRPFTDDELERIVDHLNAFPSFHYLDLVGSHVTDSGLRHLHRLRNLDRLRLNHTAISDAGLEHLAGITTLQVIDLTKTKVTDEGVAKLQQSLPNAKISY